MILSKPDPPPRVASPSFAMDELLQRDLEKLKSELSRTEESLRQRNDAMTKLSKQLMTTKKERDEARKLAQAFHTKLRGAQAG